MTREEIFDVVRSNVATIIDGVEPDTLAEDVNLRDLGADSLQVVEIVSRSMKQLRLRVPRTELSRAGSLGELLDIFERAAGESG